MVLYAVERRIIAFLNSTNRIRFLLFWFLLLRCGQIIRFVHSTIMDQFLTCSELLLRNVVQHDKYRFLALLEMTRWVGMRIKEQGRNAQRDD